MRNSPSGRHEAAQALGVVAHVKGELGALGVRLDLLLAREALVQKGVEPRVDEGGHEEGVGLERLGGDPGDSLERLGPPDGVEHMLVGHVGHLVGEDAGELGLVAEVAEGAPGDENVSARAGEGVHALAVQHPEGVGNVRPAALERDGRPHEVDVVVELGVVHQAAVFPGEGLGAIRWPMSRSSA